MNYFNIKRSIFIVSSDKCIEEYEKIDKFIEKTKKIFKKEIQNNGCIGSIAELYDSVKPQLPKGAIAQGWSVAEIFRIILKR